MIRWAALILAMMTADIQAKELRVGVRPDAVSMSYKVTDAKREGAARAPGPLAGAGFDGFVVHICDSVLTDLNRIYGGEMKVHAVEVKAYKIWSMLEQGELDIICGPTTATQERMQGRIASPPIFVSGVSYASRRVQEANACVPIAGMLRSSTAGSVALRTIIESSVWPSRDAEVLIQYLTGGGDWKTYYKDCDGSIKPLREFDTHDELSDAFCKGELKHYVGDLEIIARSLQSAKIRTDAPCDFILSDRVFSEERYVIIGRARSVLTGESSPFVAHFFEILSRKLFFQPSVIDSAFESSFPFAEPSRKLDFLFWALRGNRQ